MPRLNGQPPRIKQGFSLRQGQLEALREMADRDRHGNVSLIVQNLVDDEMERRGMTVPIEAKTTEQQEAA